MHIFGVQYEYIRPIYTMPYFTILQLVVEIQYSFLVIYQYKKISVSFYTQGVT